MRHYSINTPVWDTWNWQGQGKQHFNFFLAITCRSKLYGNLPKSSGILGSAPAFKSNRMKLVYPPCPVANTRGDAIEPLPLTSAPALMSSFMHFNER
uniref:Uncharacterized protein n=1 Tax=Arundo donax TaxID=35708 RepID=A0A0A8ZLT0_ARUDO